MNPVRNFNFFGKGNDISNGMKKIVIVAGDKSGDLYGGLLSKTIKEKFPSTQIYSFGGPVLAKYSQQQINLLSHSVCGLVEVLSSLKDLLTIFKKTKESIQKIKPDLVVLIDFPDFNLRLASELNKQFPLFYYVSPQIWAWRKKRINLIKKYVDKMTVIFKFEQEFYKKEGVEALYFGHPLLEVIKKLNLEPKKIISLLPGSRKSEVKKNLPVMLKAKEIIQKQLPDYTFRIIKPENLESQFYDKFSSGIEVVEHSYERIEESKFIIASSGTATVEIAILEVPYLIIYKVNPLTWHILKRLVDTEFIGMVNLLAKKKVVDELLQTQANPQNIAAKVLDYLKDNEKYSKLKTALKSTKGILSPQGATNKFADYIGEYLNL